MVILESPVHALCAPYTTILHHHRNPHPPYSQPPPSFHPPRTVRLCIRAIRATVPSQTTHRNYNDLHQVDISFIAWAVRHDIDHSLDRLGSIADALVRWAPAILAAATASHSDCGGAAAEVPTADEERMYLEHTIYWLRSVEDGTDARRMIDAHVRYGRRGDWDPRLGKFVSYRAGFILEAMNLSFGLRSAGSLTASMHQSFRLLPETWRSSLSCLMSSAESDSVHQHVMASPATLSRARLTVDVSLMMLMRERHDELLHASVPPVVYILVDSSPQGGRNWELTELQIVRGEDIRRAATYARELMTHYVDTFEDAEHHDLLCQSLAQLFIRHVAPPAALGTRQSGLPMKLHAMVHSLRLECSSWATCAQLCASVCGICSDMGTEMEVNRVDDIKLDESFWYWEPPVKFDGDGVADEPSAVGADVMPDSSPALALSFAGSLYVPGSYHLVDGLSKAIG